MRVSTHEFEFWSVIYYRARNLFSSKLANRGRLVQDKLQRPASTQSTRKQPVLTTIIAFHLPKALCAGNKWGSCVLWHYITKTWEKENSSGGFLPPSRLAQSNTPTYTHCKHTTTDAAHTHGCTSRTFIMFNYLQLGFRNKSVPGFQTTHTPPGEP